MKNMTIGLAGLTFNSENLGCAALAYSFLDMLCNTSVESINIILFENPVILNDKVLRIIQKLEK